MTRIMILATMLSLPLAAAPNLSGNWVLNVAKSQYGQFPAPEIAQRRVRRKAGVRESSGSRRRQGPGEFLVLWKEASAVGGWVPGFSLFVANLAKPLAEFVELVHQCSQFGENLLASISRRG